MGTPRVSSSPLGLDSQILPTVEIGSGTKIWKGNLSEAHAIQDPTLSFGPTSACIQVDHRAAHYIEVTKEKDQVMKNFNKKEIDEVMWLIPMEEHTERCSTHLEKQKNWRAVVQNVLMFV